MARPKLPEGKARNRSFSWRMDDDLFETLKERAAQEDRTMAQYIERAMREFLAKDKRK
jgi:predicted transcriptional regulator